MDTAIRKALADRFKSICVEKRKICTHLSPLTPILPADRAANSYRISYLDNCAVRGFAAADTFKYVQTTGDSLKLENQAFFAVTEETRTTSENVDVEPDSDEADVSSSVFKAPVTYLTPSNGQPDGFHGLLGLALGPST